MQDLSSPQDNSASKNEYSVLEAYNISLTFLAYLGLLIKPYRALLEKEIAEEYDFLFGDICLGIDSYTEWNVAIYRLKNIEKEDQKKIEINIQDVFLCTIEFCKIFSERWQSKLEDLVKLLEFMRNEPQKHAVEWDLWKRAIDDVINKHITVVDEFDWDFDSPEEF